MPINDPAICRGMRCADVEEAVQPLPMCQQCRRYVLADVAPAGTHEISRPIVTVYVGNRMACLSWLAAGVV